MSGCRRLLLALVLGCGANAGHGAGDINADGEGAAEDPLGGCIDDNPPAEPFDIGDVQMIAQPAPVPGGTPVTQPPPTAADIALECARSGGSGCDERLFISKNAATCVARASDLAAGIGDWSVSLGYYSNHQRVGWGVMTVRERATDGYWGDVLVLDAATGEELARSSYRAIF